MNTRQPLRVGFICEGPTDEETLPVLVAKLLQRPIKPIHVRKQSTGFTDFRRPLYGRQGPAWGMFKSYVKSLLIEGAEVVVVAADNDGDIDVGQREPFAHKRWCMLGRGLPFGEIQPPLLLIDTAEPERAGQCRQRGLEIACPPAAVVHSIAFDGTPVIIGVAVQMLEAWLLALPDVMESVLWEPLSPEERALCVAPEVVVRPKNDIIHRHNGGDNLSQEQAHKISVHPAFVPGPIEAVCPSFALWAADIRALADPEPLQRARARGV